MAVMTIAVLAGLAAIFGPLSWLSLALTCVVMLALEGVRSFWRGGS